MIQVRPTTYRRQEGYTVCGYPPEPFRKAFPVRIFTTTRASANHIAAKLRQGLPILPSDFNPPTESEES